LDENLESSNQRSGAMGAAASGRLDAVAVAPVGRASPRLRGDKAATAEGDLIEDGSPGVLPHQVPDITTLTRAMARGGEAAYREFYNVYFDRLLRYLLVVTGGNEESAREALQLALVRVVRHVKPFDTEEKFWSWLTVLARSAFVDEGRKRRRYFAFLERFTRQREPEPSGMDNGEADEQLRVLLERNLIALPVEERELVEQKYQLRLSVRDIADKQQTTEKAVESRLSRVRRKLKDAVLAELKNEPSS
jgi:RNA polymerase sigma-70 factor (ECF subfamily)